LEKVGDKALKVKEKGKKGAPKRETVKRKSARS